ncbi:MAG: transposase [Candidatus Marinimicrobia bacterium]|nr:transposase [Candidatus Neomarinimicrobiota bacterium]
MIFQRRKPNRLPDYDYSQPGYYFVTICVRNYVESLGQINAGVFIPNTAGSIVDRHWRQIPNIDEYQVMPNHVHGILVIKANCLIKTTRRQNMQIPKFISRFKMQTAKQIRTEIDPDFRWQRSYYDHVIRNEESLEMIREYILSNPQNWVQDRNRVDDNPFV